uniref:NADH-ubiquinone oxidoreductase chain 2 n=1 Tax=Cucujoidea sp. 26 KM-2017 TaxID=2219363 RepID=A0A346RH88_9CUCU|nr:NADH dehydrogenase subunit 2 [Cucujoidea sp. 26 KM-2017]
MAQSYKILFFNSMIFSSLMAISSYSWFSMWLSLEINLLSIIPLFNSMKNYFPSEAALKYFITQSMASTIILFSILNFINFNDIFLSNLSNQMIFNSAILTKMGAAPFHFWFPEIMEGLSWFNNLIIMTWQKIAPFMIISYNMNISYFFTIIILCSTMMSSIMGFNQISLRKIMAFSSINHIGWMLSSLMISNNLWMIYFLIYSFISISLIFMFYQMNSLFLYQFFNFNNSNNHINFFLLLIFLSLGGLPPFLGFLPKWLTINGLVTMNMMFLSFFLIIFTLIMLFIYIRLIFNTFLLNFKKSILKKTKMNTFFLTMMNILNLMGLTLCPLIFNFY